MMLAGWLDMQGRTVSEANDLETLGMVAVRMLFASGALQGPLLIEAAVKQAAERDLPVGLPQVRRELERMFEAGDDFARMGVTFHTLM